jgi:probable phosphoglycerate mutase
MTEFLLIRHAVNDFVKTHKLAGWTPGVHLNDDGKAQAVALGLRLAKTHIDAVYASPLERTVETAQAVLEHHPELTLQHLEDIGEVRYGDWTGQEIRKLAQRKMWRVIQINPSRASFPNGEAMRDVQLRAINALEKLAAKHPRERVAVVSHSDVIKMILAHYLGMHLDLFQRIEVSPASLSIIVLNTGRPTIVQINETDYLPKAQKPSAAAFEEAYTNKQGLSSIVVDAVGEPGARTFYLQATLSPEQVITLLIEKTQALMLAEQVEGFLSGIPSEDQHESSVEVPVLHNPDQTLFRAGQFGLQYNQDVKLIELTVTEMIGQDQGTPNTLQLWVSRSQLQTLADYAQQVARSGSVAQH